MKKLILYLFLLIPVMAGAQKYVPFPTENAQWNVFYSSNVNDAPMDTTLLQYSLQGDTTINSIVYHKVCRNIGTIDNPIYKGVGGLREKDKKIYYSGIGYTTHFGSGNSEYLLYDFTKQIGDTVWVDKTHTQIKYIIENIDSVSIGNKYRKRYKVSEGRLPVSDYIIEGIGSVVEGIFGRITPIPTCSMCHQEWHFVCFSQNGESVYKNPDFVDCGSVRKWSDIPYVPFPTSNAVWSQIKWYQGVCDFPCKYQYKMMGDTIINSIEYHKIFKQEDSLSTSVNAVYFGALRESAKKIYFQSRNCNHEVRLYDFSKNVGDTINNLHSEFSLCDNSSLSSGVITKIDTVLVDGSYRKAFHLDILNNDNIWIEGIGCTNGLFNPVIPPLNCMCAWYLVCYHLNNDVKFLNDNIQLKYLDPNISCFPTIIDGVSNPIKSSFLLISPNPVTESSQIKWEIPLNSKYATLTITDALGKRIKTIDVSGKTEVNINRSDYAKGLYIGKLDFGTGTVDTVKIIIE